MNIRATGPQLVLELAGELDISTCPPIRDALSVALGDDAVRSVVFDLRDVTFMDSSAIKCMIYALHRTRVRGGSVTARNARPSVARLIQILGLDREIELSDVVGPQRHDSVGTAFPEPRHEESADLAQQQITG